MIELYKAFSGKWSNTEIFQKNYWKEFNFPATAQTRMRIQLVNTICKERIAKSMGIDCNAIELRLLFRQTLPFSPLVSLLKNCSTTD